MERVAGTVRTALSAVLIALACLLAPLGAVAAWATYGFEDGARYAATTNPLASDAQVREAVAGAVTDSVMREVHVGPRLRDPVHAYIRDAVRSFTATEAYRTAWGTANLAAHDAVLRALRADERTPPAPVVLDLAPATERMKRELADEHVPLAARIPIAHTEITLVEAHDLGPLRKGFRVLEVAGFWLPLSAVVLACAGIAVAVCRRRAIVATGLGTALGAASLGIAIAVGRHLTVGGLPSSGMSAERARLSAEAVGAVYDALTETLRTVSWSLLALGLTVAVGAWATGAYVRHRRHPAPAPLELELELAAEPVQSSRMQANT
ncbi:hypothetical protein OK074_3244 [Actinobacteria bacterium OK074]|nr:hypothetical protein OK074_3244 [Actinobacteria bacterium OK074]